MIDALAGRATSFGLAPKGRAMSPGYVSLELGGGPFPHGDRRHFFGADAMAGWQGKGARG